MKREDTGGQPGVMLVQEVSDGKGGLRGRCLEEGRVRSLY